MGRCVNATNWGPMKNEYSGNLEREVSKLFKIYLSTLHDSACVLMYDSSSLGSQGFGKRQMQNIWGKE